MSEIRIVPVTDSERPWMKDFISEQWGAPLVVGHAEIYHPHELPGFIALNEGERVGLVTYVIKDQVCEIVSIDSLRSGLGVGSALIASVKAEALRAGCRRLWLVTTNDNLNALRFYQKRGFRLVAVHPDALEASRRLKPEIPLLGSDDIPLRDELELEIRLS